jgi:hypothetical protein
MATFIDRDRVSTTTALASFDMRVHVYPSNFSPFPLDEYWATEIAFGSNQQSAIVQFGWTGDMSMGTNWNYEIHATVTCNNGFGTTQTTTITLVTGTGTAAQADTGISVNVGAVTVEYEGKINQSRIYWDILESAFGTVGSDYPDISYRLYERVQSGATVSAKIVLNGNTVTASGTASTASDMDHDLDASWYYQNNTTTAKSITISNQAMNSLSFGGSIPTYSHTANNQSTTYTQSIVTGNGLGAPYYGALSYADVTTSTTFKRDITLRGRIMAFALSYPDTLDCRITGYDNATLGYRDVTATSGSFDASDTFRKTSVTSELGDPSASPSTQSSTVNTVPSWVYADIKSASLSALGDDSTNTKMQLRGWSFSGASVSQARTTAISTGVTTATRTFASPGVGLNSYRYLRVQVRRTSGTTRTGTISITTQPNSVVKSWDFTTSSGTMEYIYLDLCSPDNKTSTIDETDHPYPRMNPSDTGNTGQAVDGDYWGITRTTEIAVTGTAIEMGDIHLSASNGASAWCTGFWTPVRAWTKQKFTSYGGNTQTTNRLYQGDTEGNTQTEEGWALWQTSPSSNALMSITDLVNDINASDAGVTRHCGYTASASTTNSSPTYVRNGYANSVNGYAIWLGGKTRKRGVGEKMWTNTDQSDGGADVSVLAQTMFRKLNGDFVPDAYDPFEQEDAGSQYVSTLAVSYQRGRAHGLVLGTDTEPNPLQTVYLRRDSDLSSRGSGTSSTIGVYYTALPCGLGNVNHNTVCESLDTGDPDPLPVNKQQRAVFKLEVGSGDFLSGDKNALLQHYYATVNGSGTVSLWKAQGPLATSYTETVTSLTGIADLYLRCLHPDPAFGIVLFAKLTTGNLVRYYTEDEGGAFVSTVINTSGGQPAFCVDDVGMEFYIWRTSGGAIQGKILDASGDVIMGVTTLVSANVADMSIDIYERLDDLYILYNHTSNGITVVRSTDGGRTYA